ncbi:MAG: hypothetical protein RL660_2918 [Bacteroidota bacterium]|jgi:folate-dependent phosphoribosylglycinamide formyltransferase PurN
MENKRIVLLAGKGQSTNIVFNAIDKQFGIHTAILEEKENTKVFIKRRIKRLGLVTVVGQIIFQVLIAKPLGLLSGKRQAQILQENKLDPTEIPTIKVKNVLSVNAEQTISLLREINPDLIIVNGTRIISKKVLQAVNCKFINTHAGITPKYRGVHGSYWALVNKDAENSGVTVHFVDEGIDTGTIINQCNVQHGKQDNFSTYPTLQLAAGIEMLLKAVQEVFADTIQVQKERALDSKLWYHPTIWQYLYYRIFKGVK